jgi:hypothetical protein
MVFSWLRNLAPGISTKPTRSREKQRRRLADRGRFRPRLEPLEERVVAAISAFFSMPTNLTGSQGTVVSVPLSINHLFDDASDQGLNRGVAVLTYDPTVFTVSNTDISQGALLTNPPPGGTWAFSPNAATPGEVDIAFSSPSLTADVTSQTGGVVAVINFHIRATAPAGSSTIHVVVPQQSSPNGLSGSAVPDSGPNSIQEEGAGYTLNPADQVDGSVLVGLAATHFGVTASPSSITAGSTTQVVVTALDAENNPVKSYSGTVHFTSTDSQAVLPPNSMLSGGNGTFTVTLNTAGSQTVTATDTSNSSITGTSNTITVSAAAATHFAVSAPASATAGTAFNFTVTALDQFNNAATSYGGTVHFTSSDAAATLPADGTLTNGAGTFSATLRTVGSQTLTATDTANGNVTGTSGPIAVTSTGQPALTAVDVVGYEFTPFTKVVAAFTHNDGGEPLSNFSATINWGDGTTTAGKIIVSGGIYCVLGTKTYDQRSTTLGFADGVYPITVTVQVTGGPSATGVATARILSELPPDGEPGTPTERFIAEVYRVLLHRQVDAGGLAAWSNYLDTLNARGLPLDQAQYATVLAIELEPSHEYLNALVASFYEQYLGRSIQPSDGNNPTNMVNFIAASAARYPQAIDFATTQVRAMFMASPEYLLNHGGTNAGLVEGIYQDVLGRTAQGDGAAALDVARLDQGLASAMQIATEVLLSNEGETDLVAHDYMVILNRDAGLAVPPESQSIQAWVQALQAGLPEPLLTASIIGNPYQEFYNSTLPVT